MRTQSTFRKLGALAVVAVAIAMAPSTISAQPTDSEQISKLLPQARSHAVLASDHAETLESYTRSKLSWKSHAVKLETMKMQVNELGKLNKQLVDLRSEGSPWQQKAIDQIDVRLREVAVQLNTTISHLNKNQSQVHMQTYRDYVQGNQELTSSLAEMIDDYVDYDEAKSQAESLEHRLELPVSTSGM